MQSYLIDTQIILWILIAPHKLSARVMQILQTEHLLVSQISLFEIAIKQKIGKLPEMQMPIAQLIATIQNDGLQILPLKDIHLQHYNNIPLIADHRDPFDRLILATSLSENIPIISADEKFTWYKNIVTLVSNE
jgi:PIN domain nuclease of toxin-antitoxin system